MFCENCGSRLQDGERFCSNCGSPVKAAAQQPAAPQPAPQPVAPPQPVVPPEYQQPRRPAAPQYQAPQYQAPQQPAPQYQPAPQNYAPQFGAQPEQKPKKKKRTGILVAGIALVLVAAFVVTAIATGLFGGGNKGVVGLEKKSLRSMIDTYHEVVDVDALTDGATYTIELEPGEYLKTFATSQGIDLSWLNSATVELVTDIDDGAYGVGMNLSLNGVEIVSLSGLIDTVSGQILMDLGDLADGLGSYDFSQYLSAISGSMPDIDEDEITDLIEKYYGIILDALDEPEESKGTFTANGVSESCTVYTLNITQKSVYKVAKKVLEKVVDDGDIKSLLKKIYPSIVSQFADYGKYLDVDINDFDEVYSYLRTTLKSYLSQFDQIEQYATDETVITLEDYASGGKIIGRVITVQGHEILFGNAHDGDRFGTELTVDGTSYLLGIGTYKGSVVNGEMSIYYRDTAMATVKVTDYDYDKHSGVFEITLPSDVWYMITRNKQMSTLLSTLSLRVNVSDSKSTFDVIFGGQSALKATVTKSSAHSVNISKSGTAKDIQTWASSIDLSALLDRLKRAGVPDSLLSGLQSALR